MVIIIIVKAQKYRNLWKQYLEHKLAKNQWKKIFGAPINQSQLKAAIVYDNNKSTANEICFL